MRAAFGRPAVIILAALVLAVAAWAAGLSLPQDRGPATLDVSSYPPKIQAGYRLVVAKCGQCHTLARVFNTTASPQFWAHYLGGLQSEGKTTLSNDEAVQVYDFLIYDEIHRKEKNPTAFAPPLTEDQLDRLRAAEGVGKGQ